MTTNKQRVGWGAFPKAMWAALQWRVMLIWIVLMALPTAIAALPVGHALGALLDHSVHSNALAHKFDGLLMGDAIMSLMRHNAGLGGAYSAAFIVTLLLSPFLTSVVVTAVRSMRQATLGELMHGGLHQYWRMLRLMLWSLIPYGIAFGVGNFASGMASAHAQTAVLQSVADRGDLIAKIVLLALVVLAHAIMESSRAQFAADESLRSATRAFGRGIGMLVRRPLATLGLYLGTSIVGYALVVLVGMLRIRTDAVGVGGYILAIALAQLIVVILAWQRTARISALTMVACGVPSRRRHGSGATLAPAV
ncbi:MAG TPA: hypothetical protein VFK31_00505 [Rhodanobacteraceae bacterium]|nr:hypothetical protein [Rhodanobacteraceae bacterium]